MFVFKSTYEKLKAEFIAMREEKRILTLDLFEAKLDVVELKAKLAPKAKKPAKASADKRSKKKQGAL